MNDFYIPILKYVYFDEDGNLLSVSNNNLEEGSYFETTYDEVKNLISGKEQFSHYVVLFDTIKKSYILKHRFKNRLKNILNIYLKLIKHIFKTF